MDKNKISKAIIVFNLVITPLVFMPNQTTFDYFYFPKHVVLMVSCLMLVIPLWTNRHVLGQIVQWDNINKILLAYVLYLGISVFFAADRTLAISGSHIRQEGLVTILFYVLLFLAARSIGQLDNRVYGSMIITGVIISLYGTLQYFGFDFVQREYFRGPNSPISTIGNQNFIGSYFVLILPLSIHFWKTQYKKISLIAYTIILFGLLVTMSRGPWIGYAVSILVYILLDYKMNRHHLLSKQNVMLLGATISVVFVFTVITDLSFFERLISISNDVNEVINNAPDASGAGSGRWFIWQKSLILIKENPWFGVGIENLGMIFPKRFLDESIRIFGHIMLVDKAHNEYLDMMVSSGIPSLVIYLGFLFSVLKDGFVKLQGDPMKIALMASLIGYSTQAFFNIRVVTVAYVFWIFLALLINSPQSTSQKTTDQ